MVQGRNIKSVAVNNKVMSLEVLSAPKNKSEQMLFLQAELGSSGLEDEALLKYEDLISKVDFKNINLSSEAAKIHIEMLAALLTEQDNEKVFFQNILNEINQDLNSVDNVIIVSAKEIQAEQIDLDIGTNRRVDRFYCSFADGANYEFTLSADLEKYKDDVSSNSFIEKKIFAEPLAVDNPWLQKYFAYIKKESRGEEQRFIAKEYLPGKNIVQYFNESELGEDIVIQLIDVACETAYTMSGLYKRMDGELLADLKLENIIYNYENPDGASPACRICDHAGYYDDEAAKRSSLQILAQISSFMSLYYSKTKKDEPELVREEILSIIDAYLDSFIAELSDDLRDKFVHNVKELRKTPSEGRQWQLSDDLIDYVLSYNF